MTVPGLEVKNSPSDKGTRMQNKIIIQTLKDYATEAHRFKSEESL